MKVLIAGGSGFIGRALTGYLRDRGHEVRWLSRKPGPQDFGWEAESLDRAMAWADGVVNLAGELVLGIWTKAKKVRIMQSRIGSTRKLVEALARAKRRPKVLVSGSAIGYYGHQGDEALDERSGPAGGQDFLSKVCREWEAEALKAKKFGLRVCLLRTGHVLSPKGGVLKAMLLPFKLGLGGPLGDGSQWTSWIHMEDECGLILHLLKKPNAKGPFNASSPNPLTNKNYSKILGKILKRPAFIPIPSFVIRTVLREASRLLLDSQKVFPRKALESGFKFQFPNLEPALKNLLIP
jgi:uncharacterized protein (TIGR01777 family)